MDESTAIALCQKGKLEYFSALYEAYADKIYRYIFYRVRHKEVAEDLTSETFFKAMDKISSFRSSKGGFNSWLYRIARNTLIDDVRKARPSVNIDDIAEPPGSTDVVKEVSNRMEVDQLAQEMDKLTDIQKEIVKMRLWDEFSYKEMAEVLGKSEGSIKMIYHRSIKMIKQRIQQHE